MPTNVNATSSLHSRGSPTASAGSKITSGPVQRGTKLEVAASPLPSQGSPTPSARSKIRSGYVTRAFSGAQKRAEMLHHPCILGGPQQRAAKSEMAASPLPSRGQKRGGNAASAPHSRGFPMPSAGSKIRIGCLTPAGRLPVRPDTPPPLDTPPPGPYYLESGWNCQPGNFVLGPHGSFLPTPWSELGEVAISDFAPLCWGPPRMQE